MEEEEEGEGRIRPEKLEQASREILELREIQTCMSALQQQPAALSKQSRQAAMHLASLARQLASTLVIQELARKAKCQHQVGSGPAREHSFCSQIITQI